jgi:hypothetical protein
MLSGKNTKKAELISLTKTMETKDVSGNTLLAIDMFEKAQKLQKRLLKLDAELTALVVSNLPKSELAYYYEATEKILNQMEDNN